MMKKVLVTLLAVVMVLSLAACTIPAVTPTQVPAQPTDAPANPTDAPEQPTDAPTEAPTDEPAPEAEVLTYAEYIEADLDTEVTIQAYVQDTQSWWAGNSGEGVITVYAADENGGYFIYEMACPEADAAKLVPGTCIKVTGYKSEWAGEVEITDGKFEIVEGKTYSAIPRDVTEYLGKDDLKNFMNDKIYIKGLTVNARKDADGNEVAFQYKYDGSGSHDENSDLYFDVNYGGAPMTLTVESYLRNNETDVYKAVENLKVGDKIDVVGYLYWYEGANPHITNVTVVPDKADKSEDALTYADYMKADLDTEVTIEAYVQATQSWWPGNSGEGVITVYAADSEGGYFIYEMACSEEDAAKLVPGTCIKVTGYKSEWAGEVEITDGKFEIVPDKTYVTFPDDVTALVGKEEIQAYMNSKVSFRGATVIGRKDADGNEVAFQYKYDGSGSHDENSDLYFDIQIGGASMTMTVESYLCNNETEVYKAVENLQIGDKIDLIGYLYWYEGANPHIVEVRKIG